MKNPYEILGIPTDATSGEIVKSQFPAMKAKKYSLKEISEAIATLRDPAKRLAIDVVFQKVEVSPIPEIPLKEVLASIDVSTLNPNRYDSLQAPGR